MIGTVHCSNKECKHCYDGECKNVNTTKDLLKDKDTVYVAIDSCNYEEDEYEDSYSYDRTLFDTYIQQEVDGYY
jgi:hypothetical protein